MGQKHSDSSRFLGRKNIRGAVITAVIAVSFFIPTPYYLYQPGSAEELAPMVTVEGGDKAEKGTLMLTTVASVKASNIYYLGYGLVAPHTELKKEEEVRGDMSDDEYSRLLDHMMTSSQHNAVVAGLTAAKEPVTVHYEGVFVRAFLDGSKAKGVLQIGDILHTIDGKELRKVDEMSAYIQANKKPGDHVKVGYTRDGKEQQATLDVVEFSVNTKSGLIKRVGLGMQLENETRIENDRDVKINAEDIGGPSAGLMFSLEIYNQIAPGDLTKGYRIAGTGTITMDGEVGQIGGIRHKIVAAHDEGADIFFAPADLDPTYDSNAYDAADEVKKLGYKMKVVPVATLQEAIDYLSKLEPKQ
ncbi:PDZ domain-containing protein [Tumebacillus sp. BK434]|uniref:SepM family pheromone-processing serine protease n=1 Tax=Tumebacillus sp. BK434 TaxID=2512169 RepID=UPI00104803AF|nr:SepM family pheromone-processing serine protease [Tumebacillus sp. BK434]TCP52476.1 PDZ domain-containing protein [Tumebacillus sp. BK434]